MTASHNIAGHNFRSIGPVRGRDGRRLKPGRLFRSGDLAEVTERCVAELRALEIRAVIDLRSAEERRVRPYTWLPLVDEQPWEDNSQRAAAALANLVRHADADVEDVMEGMRQLYRELPFSHADSYAALFRRAAEGRVPLLFGCAAGKDRTGAGAALLLWSMGVDFDEIFEDYLQSNETFEALRTMATRKYGWGASPKVDVVLRAESTFLKAMIDEVKARCGGIDSYTEKVLGITAAERVAIERNLLS